MNVRQDARQHQRRFKKRRFKLKGEVFFVKVSPSRVLLHGIINRSLGAVLVDQALEGS